MNLELKNFIHSPLPIKIEQTVLKSIINHQEIQEIESASEKLRYFCGQEYSQYIKNCYETDKDVLYIFKEQDRYFHHLDEMDFYLTSNSGMAASAIIKDHKGVFSESELWDIRSFIGKKNDSSCLHFDWNSCPILLMNCYGEKTIELYSPEKSLSLQGFGNFSLEAKLPPEHTISFHEGEAVIIPPFWWHKVFYNSNAKSFSLRFRPSNENEFLIRNLYPSWKFLTYSSIKNSDKAKFQLDLQVILNKNLSPLELFTSIELLLNRIIGFNGIDHPFYSRYIIDYLTYYKLNDLNEKISFNI